MLNTKKYIIYIYLFEIKTQRFLGYTVLHVFPQSSDGILFYTVCFLKHITFHNLTIVENLDSLDVIKE